MNKKGISLITLVITIVIIIILAGAVMLNLSKNNPINEAERAKLLSDIDTFNSQLTISKTNEYTNNLGIFGDEINAFTEEEILKYIPSMNKVKIGKIKYTDILVISEGELAVDGKKLDKVIKENKLDEERSNLILEALGGNIINASTYDIVYNMNYEGAENVTDIKIQNIDYTLKGASKRDGYKFKEWNTSEDGSGISYRENDKYIKDNSLTLYAIWDLIYLTAEDIDSNPEKYYGAYVEYTPKNECTDKWRIFLTDNGKIHLISEDYVENKYFKEAGFNPSTNSDYEYSKYCIELLVPSLEARKSIIEKMLDTTQYDDFVDIGGKAISACASPTIEQWVKSYNKVNRDNLDILYCNAGQNVQEVPKIPGIEGSTEGVANSDGYVIKYNDNDNYNYGVLLRAQMNKRDLYVLNFDNHAWGMWFSSESSYSDGLIFNITNFGQFICIYKSDDQGFRPIITLSDTTKLADSNSDGIYELY